MKPMQNTIIPRTPLTVTELETLAVMLDNGTQKISNARTSAGGYAWDQSRTLTDVYGEIFGAFYQIRENTALLACGDQSPLDMPQSRISITGNR